MNEEKLREEGEIDERKEEEDEEKRRGKFLLEKGRKWTQ